MVTETATKSSLAKREKQLRAKKYDYYAGLYKKIHYTSQIYDSPTGFLTRCISFNWKAMILFLFQSLIVFAHYTLKEGEDSSSRLFFLLLTSYSYTLT